MDLGLTWLHHAVQTPSLVMIWHPTAQTLARRTDTLIQLGTHWRTDAGGSMDGVAAKAKATSLHCSPSLVARFGGTDIRFGECRCWYCSTQLIESVRSLGESRNLATTFQWGVAPC